MATATDRKTAAERREEILDAALVEFAERGLHGTSTERSPSGPASRSPTSSGSSARRRSSSSPPSSAASSETLEMFRAAAAASAARRRSRRSARRTASCSVEPDRCCAARCRPTSPATTPTSARPSASGYGDLVEFAEQASGATGETVAAFFAHRDAPQRDRVDGAARRRRSRGRERLLEGCEQDDVSELFFSPSK